MLDEIYGIINEKDIQDQNAYFAGRLHRYKIVIAALPAGIDGVSAAANVARDMMSTFKYLRFGLLVDIGGGIPDPEKGFNP